jgi:hypothetical protein
VERLPTVFITRIQYKHPGAWNTYWHVTLVEQPDLWLGNFTIVPSNLNTELRLAKYFSVLQEHNYELWMWHQNDWPTFCLRQVGEHKAVELLMEYSARHAGRAPGRGDRLHPKINLPPSLLRMLSPVSPHSHS